MKYSVDVDIDLPRDRVIELFDNADNMPKWQPELISFKPLSGEPGQVGSTSQLVYKMGEKELEMIETITERKLPNLLSGTYEAKGVYNEVSMEFTSLSAHKTKLTSNNIFRFSGFMAIMSFFMKGAFKKQTLKYLVLFKEFAESSSNA